MYDIDTKVIKHKRLFGYLFLVSAAIFIVILICILHYWNEQKSKLTEETMSISATVKKEYTDKDELIYIRLYKYEVNNKIYTCSSSKTLKEYPEKTENKMIHYHYSFPDKCYVEEFEYDTILFILAFLTIPTILTIIGIKLIKKVNKRLNQVEQLNQNGRLVKRLPYKMEKATSAVYDGEAYYRPVIMFTLKTGEVIKLKGDIRYDRRYRDRDGYVDLLIDEFNPENYFIDFDINRKGGNLPTDYYTSPDEE